MDIGALLIAADEEVPYEKDAFESLQSLKDERGNWNKKDGKVDDTERKRDILFEAAKVVRQEEEEETRKLFKEAAKEIQQEIDIRNNPGLETLIEATKEVLDLPENDDHDDKYNEDFNDDYKRDDSFDHNNEENRDDDNIEQFEQEDFEPENNNNDDDNDDGGEEYDDEINQEFLFSCHLGHADRVRSLLKKHSINLLYRDRHGWTPLHWAASKGYNDIIEDIIAYRKDTGKSLGSIFYAQDNLAGWTPLHVACVSTQKSTIQLLIEYKVNKYKLDKLKEKPVDVVPPGKQFRSIAALLAPRKKLK